MRLQFSEGGLAVDRESFEGGRAADRALEAGVDSAAGDHEAGYRERWIPCQRAVHRGLEGDLALRGVRQHRVVLERHGPLVELTVGRGDRGGSLRIQVSERGLAVDRESFEGGRAGDGALEAGGASAAADHEAGYRERDRKSDV